MGDIGTPELILMGDIGTPGRRRIAGLLALAAVVGPLFHVVLVVVLGSWWDGYDPIRNSTSERFGLMSLASGPIVGTGLGASGLGLIQRAGMGLGLVWVVAVAVKLCALVLRAASPARI